MRDEGLNLIFVCRAKTNIETNIDFSKYNDNMKDKTMIV